MTRRANLPGADELFRSTAPALSSVPAANETVAAPLVAPAIATPKAPSSKKGVRSIARRRVTTVDRSPSGRERHDEKITVYLSPDELYDLDQVLLQIAEELFANQSQSSLQILKLKVINQFWRDAYEVYKNYCARGCAEL